MSILPQLLVNGLITGSIYALVAAGLALSYGLLRVLNFAHGHLMMVGAYSFYLFYDRLALGVFPSIIVTSAIATLLGATSLLLFIRPFTRYSLNLPLVTTVALAAILEATISLGFGVGVRAISVAGSESIRLGSIFITPLQIAIIASALFILIVLGFVVHQTSLGRSIRGLRENRQAAMSLGINGWRITLGVFTLATILAAYAGVLIGSDTNIQPTMGNSYTIKAFACMILGGLGNVWGTVLGAYLLGFIENISVGMDFWGVSLPSGYKDAFAFIIILGVLLFRPEGLLGTRARRV